LLFFCYRVHEHKCLGTERKPSTDCRMGEIFSFLQKGFIVTCSQPFLHSGARTFFLRESTLFIALPVDIIC